MVWTKFIGKGIHGDDCHWLLMKQSSIFKAQKSMSSRILCCASGGSFNIRIPTKLGRTELQGSNPGEATEIMMLSMESRLNSSGTTSKDPQRCSSVVKSMIYWTTCDKHQKLSQEEFYLCQCSMTSPVTEKATKMNVWQMPESSKYLRENLVLDNGHLLDQVLKRSGILEKRIVHKELGIILRKKCYWNSQKADILLSVQRLHCPGVNSRAKDMENCRYTSLQMNTQLKQFFALSFLSISSVSTEQWQLYVKNLRTIKMDRGEPEILMGQSIVVGESKAEVQNENSLNHQILWQQYIERIESLSPESKVSRFCMEAGFMRIVGQYFMTKDTGDFRQFRSVACREYTLPRDDPSSQPKGWIQGNMRIGPVLEVTTSFQNFKYGIEIRIWSVNQDNSQSWVRISYGTIK